MPIARFQMPDGRVARFEVPDGTSPEQAQGMMEAHFSQAPKTPMEQLDQINGAQKITAAQEPPPTMLDVVKNAAYKTAGGIPDMVLNAPNEVLNLGKAAIGTTAGMMGRPDIAGSQSLSPTPNPDLVRRALEATGLINPNQQPQGAAQKTVDVLTQGAVGGALTGGASLGRSLVGAGMGALSSGLGVATEALTGSKPLGIAAGLAVPSVAASLATKRNLSPNVQALSDEGVQLTPGQIMGGMPKRIEDAATSYPIVGDAIRMAQRRGVESFNEAAINRSLAPIGEQLPDGLVGNKAIEYAYGKLGDAYEGLLPNLKGELYTNVITNHQAQPSFKQELDQIRQMATNLPEPQRGQMGRIIDREVIDRFTSSGNASGETLKNIESKLGKLAKGFNRSDDYDVQTMGGAVQEVQDAMRRMINNINPAYQGELAKINEGYANFKRVQNAASSVGADEGVFSPAQLNRSVRSADPSKDKARFAEGNALMQDLSTAGKAVLPSSVPDSGTALRLLALQMIKHPLMAIPAGAAAVPYTNWGQRAIQRGLTMDNPALVNQAQRAVIPVGIGLADQP